MPYVIRGSQILEVCPCLIFAKPTLILFSITIFLKAHWVLTNHKIAINFNDTEDKTSLMYVNYLIKYTKSVFQKKSILNFLWTLANNQKYNDKIIKIIHNLLHYRYNFKLHNNRLYPYQLQPQAWACSYVCVVQCSKRKMAVRISQWKNSPYPWLHWRRRQRLERVIHASISTTAVLHYSNFKYLPSVCAYHC